MEAGPNAIEAAMIAKELRVNAMEARLHASEARVNPLQSSATINSIQRFC
jgi:hypothetical protein